MDEERINGYQMYYHIVLLLILAIFSTSASGQIYKYTDKNGVAHYVDDLIKVPEALRPEAEKHEELASEETEKAEIKKPPPIREPKQPSKQKIESDQEKKEIEKQSQELEKEYKSLMDEKDQIEKDIATYSKRYKTRRRKGVSRKKLKELEIQKSEWEEKFLEYKAKKKVLEILEEKATPK